MPKKETRGGSREGTGPKTTRMELDAAARKRDKREMNKMARSLGFRNVEHWRAHTMSECKHPSAIQGMWRDYDNRHMLAESHQTIEKREKVYVLADRERITEDAITDADNNRDPAIH
jgi:hypothetical protein